MHVVWTIQNPFNRDDELFWVAIKNLSIETYHICIPSFFSGEIEVGIILTLWTGWIIKRFAIWTGTPCSFWTLFCINDSYKSTQKWNWFKTFVARHWRSCINSETLKIPNKSAKKNNKSTNQIHFQKQQAVIDFDFQNDFIAKCVKDVTNIWIKVSIKDELIKIKTDLLLGK